MCTKIRFYSVQMHETINDQWIILTINDLYNVCEEEYSKYSYKMGI